MCWLQNPVASACWCIGLCQIITPVISFARDTQPHCIGINKAEWILFLLYALFAFLCNLLGPTFFDKANVFRFYKFPFSYTSKYDAVVWAFLMMFIVVLPISRKYLDQLERRRETRAVIPADVRTADMTIAS